MMPLSGGDTIPTQPGEQDSPLWPLQREMRGIVTSAVSSGVTSAEDVARVWTTNLVVEGLFAMWQRVSNTKIRAGVRAAISPPQLDLSNSPLLAGFQSALLNCAHWDDQLPS